MRWLAWMALVVALLVGFVGGYFVNDRGWLENISVGTSSEGGASRPPGDWYPYASRAGGSLTESERDVLNALGYLPASNPAPPKSGVTLHDSAAFDGLNLYISGHAPEAVLIDMDGREMHRWSHDFASIWPDYAPPPYQRVTGHLNWRRVYLFPNGDLLALHDAIGLIKLDKDSRLLWTYRGGNHHDFWVTPNGDIYSLTRELRFVPWFDPKIEVLDPYVTVLDRDGKFKNQISLFDCFRNSDYEPMLAQAPRDVDPFHTNTIEVIDGRLADRSEAFKAGNILISIHRTNAIAVIDPIAQKTVWVMSGLWRKQHESTILENGNLLVFDNCGRDTHSRILEVDPFSQHIAWSYGDREGEEFYTEYCGAVQRLPNGNTLITETKNGRAFEVTPEGKIVWEFINPHRLEQDGVTMIAALFELMRVARKSAATWIKLQ